MIFNCFSRRRNAKIIRKCYDKNYNRFGLGCCIVCILLISQKRGAVCLFHNNRVGQEQGWFGLWFYLHFIDFAQEGRNIVLCYKPGSYQVADDRGRRVDTKRAGWREGPDGQVSYFNNEGFLISLQSRADGCLVIPQVLPGTTYLRLDGGNLDFSGKFRA